MVALAEIDRFEALAGALRSGAVSVVAVEDDGADADGLLSASAACSGEQGRAVFTGYVADSETGLMYARARYYSAELGRFAGRDPWVGTLGGGGVISTTYADGMCAYGAYFAPNHLDPMGMDCQIQFRCKVTASSLTSCSYKCDQVGAGVTIKGLGTITCDDVSQPVSYSTSKKTLCSCADYDDVKLYTDAGLDCSKKACKSACDNVYSAQKKACRVLTAGGPTAVGACLAAAWAAKTGCIAGCDLCKND